MLKLVIVGTILGFAAANYHPINKELVEELKSKVSWRVHDVETNPLAHKSYD